MSIRPTPLLHRHPRKDCIQDQELARLFSLPRQYPPKPRVNSTHKEVKSTPETYKLTTPPTANPLTSTLPSLLSELQTRPTYDDLTSHPFFAGIDLTTLRQGPGPFPPPDLASDTDTSYYPPEEFILPDDELRGDKGPAAYWDLDMDLDQDTEIPDFRLPFLGPFLGHTFQWFEKTFG